MRSTALLTVSIPQTLARQVERVAKEESRTKSELLREALRLYLDTREARRALARQQLAILMSRIQERNKSAKPEAVRRVVREAVEAVREEDRSKRYRTRA
jgi:metal-responsive CopG/Arc/MetJ family transcriptional regulator